MAGSYIGKYDTTAGSNSATASNSVSVAEGMLPSNINNAFRDIMADIRQFYNSAEWIEYGDGAGTYTPAYASSTSFTIAGVNVTSAYHVGRRVKVVASTPGTIYGSITATSFSTNTTVTVSWDSGSLSDESITSVHIGITSASNTSMPESPSITGDYTLDVSGDIILDADGANVTIKDGGTTTLDIVANGTTDVTLDAPGDIILDADGADILLKDGGTQFGELTNSSSSFVIKSTVSDKDVIIKGNDGGSAINALTLDMSEAGAASFNNNVTVGGDLTVTGDDITMGTNTSGAALIADGTNFNPVVISGDIAIGTTGTAAIGSGVVVNADISSSAAIAFSKMADLTASRALYSNGSGDVTVSDVTSTELGYLDGVSSAIQTQLDAKQATITGSATTIDTESLTASRAIISNASQKIAVSDVTNTELGYLDGVTSAVQTQIDTKAATTYVDEAVAGLRTRIICEAASTANVTISSGLEAGDTIDGITLVAGDQVLLKDQSTGSQNGIYTAVGSGAGAASRSTNFDTITELSGQMVVINQGTSNDNTIWLCTTNNTVTLDSDSIAFTKITPSNVGDVTTSGTQTLTNKTLTSPIIDGNGAVFEGATADAYETTVIPVDPTADRTQYLLNQTGYVPLLAAVTTTTITATPAELNILDDVTATTAELNYSDTGQSVGTVVASKVVTVDSNKDAASFRNITLTGELDGGSLDISGDIDVDGTSNLDVVDIDGAVDMASTLQVDGAITTDSTINGVGIKYNITNFSGSMLISNDAGTGTLSSASNNTGIGHEVFDDITTGDSNTAVGYQAMAANTTGGANTAMGLLALDENVDGSNNTAIGSYALSENTSASSNTAVGHVALYCNTTGAQNVAIGQGALDANTTAGNNTAAGYNALGENTTGANNVAVGSTALAVSTTGTRNTAVGPGYAKGAGKALTTGTDNVFMGVDAGGSNTTASNNTFVGGSAGCLNSTASQNTGIGLAALRNGTTGGDNTAVGYAANCTNTTGYHNASLGILALQANTTGYKHVAIGRWAGCAITTANSNTIIGAEAGDAITTGNTNTAVGALALGSTTTAADNVAVGHQALFTNVTGAENVAIGKNSLYYNTGTRNTAVGQLAMTTNAAGNDNTAIGNNALTTNSSGDNNVAVGRNALDANTTADNNTAVGYDSLTANTTGTSNVAVGAYALKTNTTGHSNVGMGNNAFNCNTTGSCMVAIGHEALNCNTTASLNTAMGFKSGWSTTTGTGNVVIGDCAFYTNTTGSYNAALGRETLKVSTTGFEQVALGNQALVANTTGACNIGIGSSAGGTITTGTNNIAIGRSAGTDAVRDLATSCSHNIVIGNNSHTAAYIKIDWTVTSDLRDKTNFSDVPHGLDFVNKLKPVSFQFKKSREDDTPTGSVRYGFKAQDVLALEGENPVIIDNSDPENLKYKGETLVPVLVNAIKELKAEIDELKK